MFINLLRFTKALPQKLPPTHVTYRPKPRHALLLTSISYLAYHLYEAFWNTSLQFCHHPDAAEKDLLTYLRDVLTFSHSDPLHSHFLHPSSFPPINLRHPHREAHRTSLRAAAVKAARWRTSRPRLA